MSLGDLELEDVIEAALDHFKHRLNTSTVGKITKYDPKTKKADVQPLVKTFEWDEEEVRHSVALPTCTNVPVCFPVAGGYTITFPIIENETLCILHFAQSSLDSWLNSGKLIDPNDERRHDLSDGLAVLGIEPFTKAIEAANDRMVVGQQSGHAIHISKDGIKIGSNTDGDCEPAGLGDSIKDYLDTLKDSFNTHTHLFIGTGTVQGIQVGDAVYPGLTGVAGHLPTPIPPGAVAPTVTSSKVKVEK